MKKEKLDEHALCLRGGREKADAYYANAVLWAVENGVTTGASATTFDPAGDCTRGQIVTFLYRCLSK